MSDIDDAQIKAEIDGIMEGVNTIMKKIDALTPKKEHGNADGEGEEQGQIENADGNPDSSDNSNTGVS